MRTKVKLAYNHNGKQRPATSKSIARGASRTINRSSSKEGTRSRGRSHHELSSIFTAAVVVVVLISSFLICCSLGEQVPAADESPEPAAKQRQQQEQKVHDLISDSSSSQVKEAVSNLSVRSQRPAVAAGRTSSELHGGNNNGDKQKLTSVRRLVRRDLSAVSKRNGPAPTMARSSSPSSASTLSDSEPLILSNDNNNNNDNEPIAANDGASNGAGDESELAAGEADADPSAVDYESSDATDSTPAADLEQLPPLPADSHARPSRQSIPSATAATTTTTTTTTTRRPETATFLSADRGRPRQFASSSRSSQQQPTGFVATNEPPTFNVNMGSDRLLIKPHHYQPAPAPNTVTPTTALPPTRRAPITTTQQTLVATRDHSSSDQDPRTSESVSHELIATTRNPHLRAQFSVGPTSRTSSNERRQDLLLYPVNNNNNNNFNPENDGRADNRQPTTFMPRSGGYSPQDLSDLAAASEFQQQQASICYTPLALMLVVLMTMMTTLAVCFCTHFLFKHYARRSNRFDLVASSRQFDTKHARLGSPSAGGAIGGQQAALKQNSCTNNLLSGLFPGGDRPGGRDDEFAFDNPYFRDEQLRQQQQQQQHHRPQTANFVAASEAPPGERDQMHFIQHHISSLHTRQVTSSVKELSVLSGADSNHPAAVGAASQRDPSQADEWRAANVVDLTSQEQRQRVLADPREGDLIAVDITGHDFIGLGFDVCGSPNEGGIFVGSLLARGPARESGCIEVGDRIKCLNISFDNITLQDARDILNCGAPYKMRLLLEKGALMALADKGRRRAAGCGRKTAQSLLDNYRNDISSASGGAGHSPIKACLRKLGNLVTAAASSEHESQQTFGTKLGGGCEQQQLAHHQLASQQVQAGEWLGSAAARQKRALQSSPYSRQGHLNLAFGGSEDELAGQTRRGDTVDPLTASSVVNLRSGHRLASIDSGASDRGIDFGGRRDSSVRSSGHHQRADEHMGSSLEHFHTRNANHRLHGPGHNNLNSALSNLVINTDDEDDNFDDVAGKSNDRRRRNTDLELLPSRLEQTQSQPEIAPRVSERATQNNRLLDHEKLGGRFSVDVDDDGLENHPHRGQQQQHSERNKTTLTGSISTPTMNLLPLSQQHSATGLERRMSSRRGRRPKDRFAISEEPLSNDNCSKDQANADAGRVQERFEPLERENKAQT